MTNRIDPIHAMRILEDEVFTKCVTILKERYKDQWTVSASTEQREKLYQKVSLLAEVMNELRISLEEYQRGNK